MSDDERLEWFPCEPGALLGALAGMRAPKGYVYAIVLLRIYEAGGACPDTLDAISTRTRLNKRVVTDALNELFKEGRLYQGEGGIRNRKADEVITDSRALREKRKSAGAGGGKRAAENRKQNQGNGSSKATPPLQRGHTQEQLQEQDSLFPDGNRAPSAAMKDPPPDPEADLYRRGREVLGSAAGGMITKLLRAKGGNVALARAAIEQASTRGDAREYVGAMVRNIGGANGQDRRFVTGKELGGYAGIASRLRRGGGDATVDAEDAGADAAFGQPGPRRPVAVPALEFVDRERQASPPPPRVDRR